MDILEKIYMAGFPLLLLFTSLYPFLQSSTQTSVQPCTTDDPDCTTPEVPSDKALEFLPLMLTSVYCSLGIIWAYIRLGFIYLFEESTYQGQLSAIQ